MLNNPPTADEFKRQMQQIELIFGKDIELKHIAADSFICETLERMGYSEGINIFYDMKKWYA